MLGKIFIFTIELFVVFFAHILFCALRRQPSIGTLWHIMKATHAPHASDSSRTGWALISGAEYCEFHSSKMVSGTNPMLVLIEVAKPCPLGPARKNRPCHL
ncbi:MAG: hypothetical protein DRG82_09150 [Deltaproteobacteria bacterium]|nr:MAG: hypothetical protein DRG82_09150 [Deltaproteobacteria bacterium]